MTHASPTVYTFWSVLSVSHLGFLISHLWKFDRFSCLRWGESTRSNAFKRVMTFTYLTAVPLLSIYSVGMMVLKYEEGFLEIPGLGVIPTPYPFWSQKNQDYILPLNMVFAMAWSLEIVSHLEELCFWLFLTVVGPRQSSWFGSIQFKVWFLGSLAGIVAMPFTTWFTRHDPLKCEAYTFLVGSSVDLLITLASLQTLWVFPGFVGRVRSAGGDPEVVIRLTTFHDLNVTRVVFRFFFCVPLFILAIDGVAPHHHINEKTLWTDFCGTLAGLGFVVSSALTLLIFFPRSIEREAGYTPRRRSTTGKGEISLKSVHGYPSQLQQNVANMPDVPQSQPSYIFSYPPAKPRTIIIEEDELYDLEEYEERQSLILEGPNNRRTEVWEIVTPPPVVATRSWISDAYGRSVAFDPNPRDAGRGYPGRVVAVPKRPERHDLNPLLLSYSSPLNTNGDGEKSYTRRRHRPHNPV